LNKWQENLIACLSGVYFQVFMIFVEKKLSEVYGISGGVASKCRIWPIEMRASWLVEDMLHTISWKDSPGLGGGAINCIAVVKEDSFGLYL